MGTTKKIIFFEGQKKIAILWLIFGGILFVLILLTTLTRFHDYSGQIWSWFLPNIIPTLALIAGVLVTKYNDSANSVVRRVDRFYFRLTYYVSLFYLIILLSLILAGAYSNMINLIDISLGSSIYLGPLQGVVTTCLGLFFIKSEKS